MGYEKDIAVAFGLGGPSDTGDYWLQICEGLTNFINNNGGTAPGDQGGYERTAAALAEYISTMSLGPSVSPDYITVAGGGDYVEAAEDQVQSGVDFGANSSLTGTLIPTGTENITIPVNGSSTNFTLASPATTITINGNSLVQSGFSSVDFSQCSNCYNLVIDNGLMENVTSFTAAGIPLTQTSLGTLINSIFSNTPQSGGTFNFAVANGVVPGYASVTVSGGSVADVDGTYTYTGLVSGIPTWQWVGSLATYTMTATSTSGNWQIIDNSSNVYTNDSQGLFPGGTPPTSLSDINSGSYTVSFPGVGISGDPIMNIFLAETNSCSFILNTGA